MSVNNQLQAILLQTNNKQWLIRSCTSTHKRVDQLFCSQVVHALRSCVRVYLFGDSQSARHTCMMCDVLHVCVPFITCIVPSLFCNIWRCCTHNGRPCDVQHHDGCLLTSISVQITYNIMLTDFVSPAHSSPSSSLRAPRWMYCNTSRRWRKLR